MMHRTPTRHGEPKFLRIVVDAMSGRGPRGGCERCIKGSPEAVVHLTFQQPATLRLSARTNPQARAPAHPPFSVASGSSAILEDPSNVRSENV
jgi:hypothetical protein